MKNEILVELLEEVLGEGSDTSKDNRSYYCPFCGHHKKKLEIDFNRNRRGNNSWNCWVCGEEKGSKGRSIYSLFRRLELPDNYFQRLKTITGVSKVPEEAETKQLPLTLPKEFIPVHGNYNRQVYNYLENRNVTTIDVLRHNMGYCLDGEYKDRVIIPSYDNHGVLNYFVGRKFTGKGLKYLIPPRQRNVIAFESTINFDLPIILTEGMFDAISIRRNAIPLLGKQILPKLFQKILTSNVQKVYICLDNDALKTSLRHCKTLMDYGKEVYLVEMGEDDASSMGFERFTKHVRTTRPLDYQYLIKCNIALA